MGNENSSPESRPRRQQQQQRVFSEHEVQNALDVQRMQYEQRMQKILRETHGRHPSNSPTPPVATRRTAETASAPKLVPSRPPPPPAPSRVEAATAAASAIRERPYATENVTAATDDGIRVYPTLNNHSTGISNNNRVSSIYPTLNNHSTGISNNNRVSSIYPTLNNHSTGISNNNRVSSIYPSLNNNSTGSQPRPSTSAENNNLPRQIIDADIGGDFVDVNQKHRENRFVPSAPPSESPPLLPPLLPRSNARSRTRNGEEDISCPTCNNRFGVRIFNCDQGHASCLECKETYQPCGKCGQRITERRNLTMEEYVSKRKAPCPNAEEGCCLSFKLEDVDQHLKECPFQETQCLLPGGKCRWKGKLSRMAQHFDNFHPSYRKSDVDTEMFLDNLCVESRSMQLVLIGNFNFLFHLLVSETDRRIYFAVQLLGTKVSANKWNYEIHVYNKREPRRKFQFIGTCFSSGQPIEDIVKDNSCAVLPLQYAMTFINEGALAYKFYIKKEEYRRRNLDDDEDNERQREVCSNRRGGRGGRGRGTYRKY